MTTPPRALSIAGSDSGGGAGLQADLKTFLACRVHGMCAVTAVTAQNSRGVQAVHALPAQQVVAQVEAVALDIGVDAVKTGMLADAEIVTAVADVLSRLDLGPLVVDPVCASQHGDPLLEPEAVATLTGRLFPLAALVTPNVAEVEVLCGVRVHDRHSMELAAKVLHDLGPRWVLVKGGHLSGGQALDLLYDGSAFHELVAPRRDTPHTHGTGDTLAAAITAGLARRLPMPEAVEAGKQVVSRAVDGSFPLGSGLGPVGHFWALR